MDNKILITLAIISAIIIFYFYTRQTTKEGFLGNLPSMSLNVQSVGKNMGNVNPKFQGGSENMQAVNKGSFYSIPGNYQANLSPRFSNLDYGAVITYNMPSKENQAVPVNPIDYGNVATEGYKGVSNQNNAFSKNNIKGNKQNSAVNTKENFPATCGTGGSETIVRGNSTFTTPDYSAGNYKQVKDQLFSNGVTLSDSPIPVGDMTMTDGLGNQQQVSVYNNFMVSNRNSNLRGLGDPIRGDLAIVPNSTGWFRPSINPLIDLQQGAINVMSGQYNETANALNQMLYRSSGGAITTFSGVDQANDLKSQVSNGYGDINLTAFP